MQQNIGLLAGLMVCVVLALLFGLMYFHAVAETDRLQDNLSKAGPDMFIDEPYHNRFVESVARERDRLKASDAERQEEITGQKRTIEWLKADIEAVQGRIANSDVALKQLAAETDAEQKSHNATIAALQKVRGAIEGGLKQEQESYRKLSLEAEAAAQKRLEENRVMVDRSEQQAKAFKSKVLEQDGQIANLREIIGRYTASGSAGVSVGERKEFAGTVMEVDVARRVVMVDFGSFHRGRAGMRFDVVRQRGRQERVVGQIELVRVEEMVAEGVILDRVTVRKRCPVTGWSTNDPNMLYSPCVLTWERKPEDADNATQALLRSEMPPTEPVPLVADKYETTSTMDPLLPIQKGDRLYNPMFSSRGALKFAVLGRPYIGDQDFKEVELIVRYLRRLRPVENNRVAETIRLSGGEVVDEITPDVDFVVCGRMGPPVAVADDDRKNFNADELAELERAYQESEKRYKDEQAMRRRARDFGIREMMEYDIARYYDQ